jgi:hypothetical protein
MAAEDRLREVRGWLRELAVEVREGSGDPPTLSFRRGSALFLIAPFGGGEKPELLRVSTCLVRRARAHTRPDLLAHLLRENDGMVFCHYSIDAEGDIWLNGVLQASHLDRKTFHYAMSELMAVADTADDQIVRRWGGERFVDV